MRTANPLAMPYLLAMRDRAPKVFNELSRTNRLDKFVEDRLKEADKMIVELRGPNPDLQATRMASEIVLSQMIDAISPTMLDGVPADFPQPEKPVFSRRIDR